MGKDRRSDSSKKQSPDAQRRPATIDLLWSGLARLAVHAEDIGAAGLGALALVTLLGLLGLTKGTLIDLWVAMLVRWFGWAGYLSPLGVAGLALALVRRRQGRAAPPSWGAVIALEILFFACLALLAIVDGVSLARAEAGSAGGVVGWGIATLLGDLVGSFWRLVALVFVTSASGAILLRSAWPMLTEWVGRVPGIALIEAQEAAEEAGPSIAPAEGKDRRKRRAKPDRALPPHYRKTFRVPAQVEEPASRLVERDERLPPLDLLEVGQTIRVTSQEINLAAGLIEKTLADFGLPARVVDFRIGPAVTQFALEPGFVEHTAPNGTARRQKVRVGQISALASDLALALSAPTLRIEAPVPGQSYVGVEVPNRRPAMVRLRPILEAETFQSVNSSLAIALGRNVSGAATAADLAAMPHLLIAGTTGSGKSVCITAIAACLVMNNAPEDLRLVMIDPKMVELLRFNGLPHLYGKVETDLERIVGVLRWCTVEMDRRYRLLEEAGARDLDNYNRKTRRRKGVERLPRIVVLIDELADLMMMAPDQTERTLVRLAQMARATGIHLVVATQRPSTDIVTGLIKANFPARIAFAVASGVDSRVILDIPGAENLLGRGDMLFLSPEAAQPVRLQGVMVADDEIEAVVDYWREEHAAAEPLSFPAPWEELLARQAVAEDRDDVLERAVELVKRTGHASASMLQRRLKVGYPRAARLMDELEELGLIGRAQKGGRTREVLVDQGDEPADDADE